MAEVVGSPACFVAPTDQSGFLIAELPEPPDQLGQSGALGLRPGKRVEEVALRVRPEERLGIVLAVNVDQHAADLGQNAHGGRAAADPCPGTTFTRDLPADHQAAVFDVEPEGLDGGTPGGGDFLENTFDDRFAGSGTDHAGIGPSPQQQNQGIHHHGFPRPGFPGQHVEARAKRQGDVFDGGEVLDPELRDHGSRSVRSPQRRLARIRAK